MDRDIAWRKWRDSIMAGTGNYHPLEEPLYKCWCAAWDSACFSFEDNKPPMGLGQRQLMKLALAAGLIDKHENAKEYFVKGDLDEVIDFARLVEDAHNI